MFTALQSQNTWISLTFSKRYDSRRYRLWRSSSEKRWCICLVRSLYLHDSSRFYRLEKLYFRVLYVYRLFPTPHKLILWSISSISLTIVSGVFLLLSIYFIISRQSNAHVLHRNMTWNKHVYFQHGQNFFMYVYFSTICSVGPVMRV